MTIQELASRNQEITWKILHDIQVMKLWESIGAEVYLVGSLKSGLLMKNKDIDLHVYTANLNITDSFRVIEKLALHPGIQEIYYKNGINTDEECIEWHAEYKDKEKGRCKIDMIHIRKGSLYDGTVEKVTEAIISKLTPEIKETILQIKFDVPDDVQIPGIEIYRAVFSGGVRNYQEFINWRKENPIGNSLEWMP